MSKLPVRQSSDGPFSVSRPAEGRVCISVTNDGEMSAIEMSDFNAARVLVTLCLFLEVPMPKALGKMKM